MSKRNQNREKAAEGAEAPHRSVQSAIREIGGTPEHKARVAALVCKVLNVFGGQIVKVLP